ncbi:hypothetical protein D9Q98_009697 [Chlorella vulgaris]|uniref:Uncharacterized protein n=1 Tax=Chlorella vulgaris TaxID=3077 RepID=A0A9D4YSN4_CHLVU|nr:hypothetical protein D9Q98_009697 [Chlorella vulgaris]
MASGRVLEKLRQLYAKMDAEVKRWAALQDRGMSLLRTVTNIISRIPALEDPGSYGVLAALPNLPTLLLSKQLQALDELIVQLQDCLDDAQAVTDSMARHAQQAQRLVQHDRSLTPAVCAVVAGPVPSITQCLRGLAEISRMHADELLLKSALVFEVRYDSSEADMQQVAALYAAQLHIDGGHVRDLLHVVAATEERRRL